jgi:hypothetical protein
MEVFIQWNGRLAGSFFVLHEKLATPRIVVVRKRMPVRVASAIA